MAEAALGAAGSIASLVSLAGQVVQGILILHGFYNDIRDAPEEVRSLRIELDQFRKLYEGLEKLSKLYRPCDMTDNVFDDLHSALIPCKDLTDKLVHQIGKYNVQHGSGKRKRVWSQVKLAVRKQQYRDYLAALERAKSTLIATQISMNTCVTVSPRLRASQAYTNLCKVPFS